MHDDPRFGFDETYLKEYRPLVAFAQRLGASPGDAEDAAQEAFLSLHIAWSRVGNPAGWLRTVVAREVRQSRRTPRRWPLTGAERSRHDAEPDWRDDALDLLRRLPWPERAAMAWEMDGYSVAETAELTGMTEVEVRRARRRGSAKLKRLIKEH
ncbi:hypothetical protein Asp14428_22590 [Actinoplanes sp. NBRC 14428]|uniref:RNA polymerase sigma-70 factor (ECF subfamily) n=1 Tax=Pseudosporangium ferrugineum TaxID=439699 RepID=A0A2T0RLF5_9ACTN|nr:sigma-70 family RNA polymerase sigma factor [Pseudosporangium ferrugineum]PRY21950.1 RNA polymerase sigma-70 factor (ECF subfamily) [Pseudosporangium ferrugineum]BCJ50784.1 hypothetical protein Asp14428_22590 [Actinoplanes sp. NBRC 14428]